MISNKQCNTCALLNGLKVNQLVVAVYQLVIINKQQHYTHTHVTIQGGLGGSYSIVMGERKLQLEKLIIEVFLLLHFSPRTILSCSLCQKLIKFCGVQEKKGG